MKVIFKTLGEKRLLQEEQLYTLKGIAAGSSNLLKRLVYKSKGKSLTQKYSAELRTFAVTLHYYSPRAYSYVRENFILVSHIQRHYVNGIGQLMVNQVLIKKLWSLSNIV